jgi:hypothetical protein
VLHHVVGANESFDQRLLCAHPCAVLQVVVSMAMIRKATDGSRPSVSAKERYVHNFYSTSVSFSPARRSLAHNISFERRAGDKERNEAGISAARYHLLGHETKRYDVLELRHMIHVRYGVSLVSLLYAESSWLCCTRDLQQSYHLLRNEAPARRCPSPSESGPQTKKMAIVTVATTVMTPLVKLASISRRTGV